MGSRWGLRLAREDWAQCSAAHGQYTCSNSRTVVTARAGRRMQAAPAPAVPAAQRTCRQLQHGQCPEALHQRGAAPVLRVADAQLAAAVAPPGVHLGGGGDAQRVEAAADDLRDHLLVQHLDGARLHPVRLCLVAMPALPVLVGAPGDDILGRDGNGVLSAAGDGPAAAWGASSRWGEPTAQQAACGCCSSLQVAAAPQLCNGHSVEGSAD